MSEKPIVQIEHLPGVFREASWTYEDGQLVQAYIAVLEAKLEAMKRDADTECRFWRTFIMNEGNQAHTEMWNCLGRLAVGRSRNRDDDYINATAQEEQRE